MKTKKMSKELASEYYRSNCEIGLSLWAGRSYAVKSWFIEKRIEKVEDDYNYVVSLLNKNAKTDDLVKIRDEYIEKLKALKEEGV